MKLSKLIAISVPCLILAVVLALHALSSVSTRRAPDQAVAFFAANGPALEQLAFRQFRDEAGDGEALEDAARDASDLANRSLAHHPLAPKAYALLAMAAPDQATKDAILENASTLNRRDLSLQALVLEKRLAEEDYTGTIVTLDQILRVHRPRRRNFFPVLRQALTSPGTAPLFVEILNGSATWQDEFLYFAMQDPAARLAMASIREELNYDDPDVDRSLIVGLALQGEVATAKTVYDFVKARQSSGADNDAGPWDSQFPPFDWQLSQDGRFRSQPDREGENLEIFARSGEGGPIAQLIELTPSEPFTISTTYEAQSRSRTENTRLKLQCAVDAEPFVDELLKQGRNTIAVDEVPANCPQMLLTIDVRAWRGEPTVRANLSPIVIAPL